MILNLNDKRVTEFCQHTQILTSEKRLLLLPEHHALCMAATWNTLPHQYLPCTRFQDTTWPHVESICLIMRSGAFSVIFPMKTVTGGPLGISAFAVFVVLGAEMVVTDGGFTINCGLLLMVGLRGRWLLNGCCIDGATIPGDGPIICV